MSLIDKLQSYLASDEEYEVDGYVLERREPDPDPRVREFDDPVSPEDLPAEDLQAGTYLLQELKANGLVGETVWEADLPAGTEAG